MQIQDGEDFQKRMIFRPEMLETRERRKRDPLPTTLHL
jgi:hypothetical protein